MSTPYRYVLSRNKHGTNAILVHHVAALTIDVDLDLFDVSRDVAQREIGRLANGSRGERRAFHHDVVRIGLYVRYERRACEKKTQQGVNNLL